jgi:hypothetical protein
MAANRFELLATWYLRFNGYFTTTNFTVHPNFRKQPGGTDADVLAVRFPHSEEFQRRFVFERDHQLVHQDRIDFLICEVKAGRCALNDSWRNPDRQCVEYAMRWMGFEENMDRVNQAAAEVYRTGCCVLADPAVGIRLLSFGAERNPELQSELPSVQQILHEQVVSYLKTRFSKGCEQITRQNWDLDIIEFADLCETESDQRLLEWAKT